MNTLQTLSHTDAQKAMAAIQAELERSGRAAVIAVADAHGELIGLLRLDGAPLASILIAGNEAWTAARERKPTRELGQSSRDPQTGFDFAYYGDSRYIGWGGGIPVRAGGQVVGAIAVSGLSELEDMELAEAGIRAIMDGL